MTHQNVPKGMAKGGGSNWGGHFLLGFSVVSKNCYSNKQVKIKSKKTTKEKIYLYLCTQLWITPMWISSWDTFMIYIKSPGNAFFGYMSPKCARIICKMWPWHLYQPYIDSNHLCSPSWSLHTLCHLPRTPLWINTSCLDDAASLVSAEYSEGFAAKADTRLLTENQISLGQVSTNHLLIPMAL